MEFSKFSHRVISRLFWSKVIIFLTILFNLFQSKFKEFQVQELLYMLLPLTIIVLILLINYSTNHTHLTAKSSSHHLQGTLIHFALWLPIIYAITAFCILTIMPAGTVKVEGQSPPFNKMKAWIFYIELFMSACLGYFIQVMLKTQKEANLHMEVDQSLQDIKLAFKQNVEKMIISKPQIKSLKDLLSKGKTQQVIEELKQLLQHYPSSPLLNQIIILSAQYYQYAERKRLNLTRDDLIENQVRHGLLQLLDELNGG